ncbi:MAG: ATP-binding protein [Melioribacteraceae bacterium]|nr:ATP-binding protein [Melioribacteraceae bacterium]
MHEIVFISGKGGTGKTSITASFAYLLADKCVVADCDVDAANMHLLLDPVKLSEEDFYSGVVPGIDYNRCNNCGACADVCRFNAINEQDGKYAINIIDCEGCGYCARVCPSGAIIMEENNVGKYFVSNTRLKNTMVHAHLKIGAENSGKLVAKVKKEAVHAAKNNGKEFVLVDGSPGIGCPVISSLSGADFVVIVTEPTVSGFHDLKRVYELVKKFGLKAGCIINKSDLNLNITNEISCYLDEEKIVHLSDIKYDQSFSKAIIEGKTIAEYNPGIAEQLSENWTEIISHLN